MNKTVESSLVIDNLLRFIVGGGTIATILVAPGMAKVLDKPTRNYFNKLERGRQEKELKRLIYYMKRSGLIAVTSEDYIHGIKVTKKAKERLKQPYLEQIVINTEQKWDGNWRIVFFDIPEEQRLARRQFTSKLKQLGFQQLQRSVWVFPYSCRTEIEVIASRLNVQKYVTYIETLTIDSDKYLKNRFKNII